MLNVDKETLNSLEEKYPGIIASIRRFEAAELPACSLCGSEDTADVQCGVIGRTINIAAATSKIKLIANGPKEGEYFCNTCDRFFGTPKGKASGGATVSMESLVDTDDYAKLYRDVTGKNPSTKDLAEMRKMLGKTKAKRKTKPKRAGGILTR